MTSPDKSNKTTSPEKSNKTSPDMSNTMASPDNSKKRTSYYYSDIIIHLDGTVNLGDLDGNIPTYHSNIVLLLTGVVREELDEATDDKNILSSKLVMELGRVTKTKLISDESGYDSEDDTILGETRKPKLRCWAPTHAEEVNIQKKPEPTNKCFNRPPSGYMKNERKPKYRSFSSTPSPRTLQRVIQSWQHTLMSCPVCKTNRRPLLSSTEFFC